MTSIDLFFSAWGMQEDSARAEAISRAFAAQGLYADPRTPAPLTGPDAITSYVSQFAVNAPGWTARTLRCDDCAGLQRVTVAFEGKGPDGQQVCQYGQYFIELDEADKITRMIGFVGTGEPA